MTNFEKMQPEIQALFGTGWTAREFAKMYAEAICDEDCHATDVCFVARAIGGEEECTRRMGCTPSSEWTGDIDEWFLEEGNGKACEDIIREWLLEEAEP